MAKEQEGSEGSIVHGSISPRVYSEGLVKSPKTIQKPKDMPEQGEIDMRIFDYKESLDNHKKKGVLSDSILNEGKLDVNRAIKQDGSEGPKVSDSISPQIYGEGTVKSPKSLQKAIVDSKTTKLLNPLKKLAQDNLQNNYVDILGELDCMISQEDSYKKACDFIDELEHLDDWERILYKRDLREDIKYHNKNNTIMDQADIESSLMDIICKYEEICFIDEYDEQVAQLTEDSSMEEKDRVVNKYIAKKIDRFNLKYSDKAFDEMTPQQKRDFGEVEKYIDRLKQYSQKEKMEIKNSLEQYIKEFAIENIETMKSSLVVIVNGLELSKYVNDYIQVKKVMNDRLLKEAEEYCNNIQNVPREIGEYVNELGITEEEYNNLLETKDDKTQFYKMEGWYNPVDISKEQSIDRVNDDSPIPETLFDKEYELADDLTHNKINTNATIDMYRDNVNKKINNYI